MSAHLLPDLVTKVRAGLPDALVVLGGPHASAGGAQALEDTGVDVAVAGEGERVFERVLEVHLDGPDGKGNDFSDIPGLLWRDPDGQTVVTAADDGTARVWDAQSGRPIRTLEGHTDRIWSAAYSPDGQYILTASDDGTARTWDARTGQTLRSLEGHTESVWSAAYSPDGQQIVTASADFTARVWVAHVEGLLDLAGSLIQREPPALTKAERGRFLGE